MQGLQQLVCFAEAAKRGSFAAAARELGASASTVAKAVARLEAGLQLRLFHRTTRRVALTADGERLFARCQRVLAELDQLQADAAGTRAAPSGVLRIDMPIVLGRKLVLPKLALLLARHPGLAVDARLSDQYADLVKDGLDVAIRVGELQDSTLVARRFATQHMLLCAAPGYLARRGTPTTPAALAGHDAIVFRQPTSGRDRPWAFRVRGKPFTLQPAPRLRLNDGEAMAEAAQLGLGITQLPHYMVDDAIAAGRLVALLPAAQPPGLPVHAVMPAQRHVPARVRALLQTLIPGAHGRDE